MTSYINDDWVLRHAERIRRGLLRRHPNAVIDGGYTVGTIEGGSLLTLQVAIDLGTPAAPKLEEPHNWGLYAFFAVVILVPLAFLGVAVWSDFQ